MISIGMIALPRLYPILDASLFADRKDLFTAAIELADAGCTLLQYRNKSGNARQMLNAEFSRRQAFERWERVLTTVTRAQPVERPPPARKSA